MTTESTTFVKLGSLVISARYAARAGAGSQWKTGGPLSAAPAAGSSSAGGWDSLWKLAGTLKRGAVITPLPSVPVAGRTAQ